jgi:hypothetical protein
VKVAPHKTPPDKSDGRPSLSFDDDVWPVQFLGLAPEEHQQEIAIYFGDIEQEWLKHTCKQFIRYSASTKRFNTLKAYVVSLRHFGCNRSSVRF